MADMTHLSSGNNDTNFVQDLPPGPAIVTSLQPRGDYDSPTAASHTSPTLSTGSSGKEKRHRNKPSLSCEICTVKKTKCDRVRPECFACQKRRTECRYSQLADLIEDSHRASGPDSPRKRQRVKRLNAASVPQSNVPLTQDLEPGSRTDAPPNTTAVVAAPASFHEGNSNATDRTPSRSSTGSAPNHLLSSVPFSHPTVSNIFKVEVRSFP